MKEINAKVIREATLKQVNKNSVVLEIAPNVTVWCHRRVFNDISNSDYPCFIIKREHMGVIRDWIAIPKTF